MKGLCSRGRPTSLPRSGLLIGVVATVGCITDDEPPPCSYGNIVVSPTAMTLNTDASDLATAVTGIRTGDVITCASALAYEWSSEDPGIATVSTEAAVASVVGVRGGVTRINVSSYVRATGGGRVSTHLDVTVNPVMVTITPSPVALQVGNSVSVTAEPKHTDGTPVSLPVTWSIANPNVATVTAGAPGTATVTGVAAGNTTVIVTAGTRTGQAAVNVAGMVLPTYVEGRFLNWDETQGLGGISVGIGPAHATTDANGDFKVDVSPGGTLNAFARGVCDAVHPLCNHELSYNSTETEVIQVAEGATLQFNLRAQRGYHLRILGGAADRAVAPSAQFPVQLDYHVWSRANLPGGNPQIVVGVEGVPGSFNYTVVPGSHDQPTANAMGTTNIMITAPAADGTYGVFALLTSVAAGMDPKQEYIDRWPSADRFIRVFTLKVCAAAPNCP